MCSYVFLKFILEVLTQKKLQMLILSALIYIYIIKWVYYSVFKYWYYVFDNKTFDL